MPVKKESKRPRHEVIERYHKLRAMAEQQTEPHIAAKSKKLMQQWQIEFQLTEAEMNPQQKQYQFDAGNFSEAEKEILLKAVAMLFTAGILVAFDAVFGAKATVKPPQVQPLEGTKFHTKKT
jgi:hypothetical protein